MQDRLENIILGNLLKNDDYFRKTIPFLKSEYFSGTQRILLDKIREYSIKYNKAPTNQALAIAVGEDRNISEGELPEINEWLQATGYIRHTP